MPGATREPGAVSRLLIEYDGTDFSGWARQPGRRTVQSEARAGTVRRVRRDAVSLDRPPDATDAGVHGARQVAS